MAVTTTVLTVPFGKGYETAQQVPHNVEFQTRFGIPLTLGYVGRDPKSVYPLVISPLAPLEHATVVREALESL